jgi:protoheme IX farnesyltransferase
VRNAATIREPRPLGQTLRAYIALTKPNIIWLLLITTVPAMVVAEGGWPSTRLVVATLIGGALAAGGANSINQYADRDIDEVMRRTRNRPLVTGAVPPSHAMALGLALGAASGVWLAVTVNMLSAVLALGALGVYVVLYTYYWKRSTDQNIVLGGAAGAAPPLIGWAAVQGSLSIEAALLFLIVFYWTPAHFWALSLVLVEDYRAAGVPMMPVVRGEAATKRQILFYTLMLVALSLVFAGVAEMHAIYVGTALLGGAGFAWFAIRLDRSEGIRGAMPLFHYSLVYLTALFAAMAADRLVLG